MGRPSKQQSNSLSAEKFITNENYEELGVGATVTPENSSLYHVILDMPLFNQRTGKREFTPYVQMFSEPEYRNFERHAESQGYVCTVLWNPKEDVLEEPKSPQE